MKLDKGQKTTVSRSVSDVRFETLIIAGSFIALLLFIYSFINKEHFIYYWDFANYWFRYRVFNELFPGNPITALEKVIFSVRHSEYNLFPVSLLLPSGLLFGNSRLSFILGNAVIFNFPTIILFAYFFKARISEEFKSDRSRYGFILAVLCFGGFPQLWVPVLCGYLGAGGLFLAIWVLTIYCRKPLTSQRYTSIFTMALLLSLMVVFRRWYAYWVLGFLLSITVVELVLLAKKYHSNFREYIPGIGRLFILGGSSFGIFVLLATPQAIEMLTTDYGDIYSGYKTLISFVDILNTLNYFFGPLTLFTAGFGALFAFTHTRNTKIATVLFLQFWVSLLLFTNTQDMGYHHNYILLPSLLFFVCFFWAVLVTSVKNRTSRIICLITIVCLLIVNFSIVVSPPVARTLQEVDIVFPRLRYFPKNRTDLGEIQRILQYMGEKNLNKADKVYVLASGYALNDDILIKGCKTAEEQHSFCDSFAISAHVDKRDGLPLNIFQSKYIITTDPVQIHMDQKDQQVIGILRTLLVNQNGFGRNFKKLDVEFKLEDNVRVLVYQRIDKKFDKEDLENLSRRFVSLYPTHRDKFTFPADILEQIAK